MGKISKQNEKKLAQKKDEVLKNRGVMQMFDVDDLVDVPDVYKPLLKTMLGNSVKVLTTAKHVKKYFDEVTKKDKGLAKQCVLAQGDFLGRGKKDSKYYKIECIDSLKWTDKNGFQMKITWRGTDKKGKKFKQSMIREENLNRPETLQHHVEYLTLRSSMDKYVGNQLNMYTPINDGYLTKD